jgi:DNA-binding response OmpR family regulator
VTDPPAARILLVEDDEVGGTLLVELLGSLGDVHWTTSAEQALEIAEGRDWDLMVSDIDLPGIDGLELVHRVKRRRPQLATLILSGHSSFDYAVSAMRAGADDYVTKPFGLAELRSRIRAVLRRAQGRVVEGNLRVGPVMLDRDLRRVTVEENPVRLTFSEFELLGCLMSRPGYAFNRQELLRAIWGDSAYRDPRAIDVHIRHLREKLEAKPEQPTLILTVPGRGYRFREP